MMAVDVVRMPKFPVKNELVCWVYLSDTTTHLREILSIAGCQSGLMLFCTH